MKKKLIDTLDMMCPDNYYPDAGVLYTHPYTPPGKIDNKSISSDGNKDDVHKDN